MPRRTKQNRLMNDAAEAGFNEAGAKCPGELSAA